MSPRPYLSDSLLDRFPAFMAFLNEMGNTKDLQSLRRALDAKSPMLVRRMELAINNCDALRLAPVDGAAGDRLSEMLDYIQEIADWQARRPGREKGFPHRLELRYSDAVRDALNRITERTGETASEIVRRLVLEADARDV